MISPVGYWHKVEPLSALTTIGPSRFARAAKLQNDTPKRLTMIANFSRVIRGNGPGSQVRPAALHTVAQLWLDVPAAHVNCSTEDVLVMNGVVVLVVEVVLEVDVVLVVDVVEVVLEVDVVLVVDVVEVVLEDV